MLLSSLKVLDFSTLLPGPFATMMLADLGADVLRVEAPNRADLTRHLGEKDSDGVSYVHKTLNRSKRSLGLDLKSPEAIEIIKKLVMDYDIVVEQFRPGVMERLGLDYDALKAINPALIYCSVTGYGQTGPYKGRAGHDINYLAISGLASYTGKKHEGPLPVGFQIADVAGGSMHAVTGILAAVVHRTQTGEGQYLDISMTDAAFALNAMAGAEAAGAGVDAVRESMVLNGGSFYNHYETKDGRYFSVGGLEPPFMKRLCDVIGRPELFENGLDYSQSSQAPLVDALKTAFKTKDFAEWQKVFAEIDACVEPTLSINEACQHEQIQARNMIVEVENNNAAPIKQIACPIKFSSGEAQYKFTGATLGKHSEQVLSECGYSPEQIDALKAAKVIK
ncbi:CoA transferase [Thalassotalea sp. LPB0316]|uniref:CaiB/BaiF CoA transferase family protein n=1 Tax=Thalassotalea sp. LPB0316 TaxID=2769490 RepID=UPI0018680455|nr:CaiB/BaiF CoA-transferase family protein [Thalassotalea sp. LPB0316]QOL24581.1 CoA transferase [Thalassotalea sp. LPB0316]